MKNLIEAYSAVLAAPDADQEVHRHQADLPEDVEQHEVQRDEDAEHAHFQQQEEDEVLLHPRVDGERGVEQATASSAARSGRSTAR